jgi:hypothetical protein
MRKEVKSFRIPNVMFMFYTQTAGGHSNGRNSKLAARIALFGLEV